jgi:hypothetical protein
MSCTPFRIDRVVDLDADFSGTLLFQELDKTPTDVSGYAFSMTIFDGSVLFDLSIGSGITVTGSPVTVTDERGQAQGTATEVKWVVTAAQIAALTDAQKLGPWTYKLLVTVGGAVTSHHWGEVEVLPNEIPT